MLLELALGLDNLFRDRPDLELALVMIVCPLVVNITQARTGMGGRVAGDIARVWPGSRSEFLGAGRGEGEAEVGRDPGAAPFVWARPWSRHSLLRQAGSACVWSQAPRHSQGDC